MSSPEEPTMEIPIASTSAESTEPMSKNAKKKLARAARIAEQKKERRIYEKERRKEKKRQMAEKRAAGEIDEEEEERKKKRARTEGPKKPFQARIVLDLGFDDMMTENEVKSLTSQLAYTYSANRKASQPFSTLLFTSLNGKTHTRLESQCDAAYKRWNDTEWWAEGYEQLWAPEEQSIGTDVAEAVSNNADPKVDASKDAESADVPIPEGERKQSQVNRSPAKPQRAARDTVVYLTADSTDELTELKEGETYIIGGICDHNRYKNLCFNKSKDSEIRSARLPIGTYLAELRTRKVLTVNQTFEILLKWVETKDWRQAFEAAVPKRKFKDGGSANDADAPTENISGEDVVVVDAAALEEDVVPERDDEPIPNVEQAASTSEATIIDTDVLAANTSFPQEGSVAP